MALAGAGIPALVPDDGTTVAARPGGGRDSGAGATTAVGRPGAGAAGEDEGARDGDAGPAAAAGSARPAAERGTGATAPGSRVAAEAPGGGGGEVKIGFLVLKVGSLAPVGLPVAGVDPQQQRAFIQAYVDEYNAAGGFHGRKIVPVFRDFEVLTADDHRAACLHLTEDQGVFAVVGLSGGFASTAVLCITEEHDTPLIYIGDTLPTEYLRRSDGMLFTVFQHGNRAMYNVAHELRDLGRLRGAVIGIVADDRTDPGGQTMKNGLIPGLARAGSQIAHHSQLAGDPNQAASQIPVEISQMRTKGVNTVMVMANSLASTNFVQTAEAQGWRPAYVAADWASLYTDSPVQNMPSSFDGALSLTISRWGDARAGRPPPPAEARCREIYQRRSRRTMAEYGSNEWGLTVNGCALIDILAAGLRNAGPQLTRRSLSAGIEHAGEVAVTQWGPGGYRPGKFDFADHMRANRFRYDCRCWEPMTDFRRTEY